MTNTSKPAPLRTSVDWFVGQVTARFCSELRSCKNVSSSIIVFFFRYIWSSKKKKHWFINISRTHLFFILIAHHPKNVRHSEEKKKKKKKTSKIMCFVCDAKKKNGAKTKHTHTQNEGTRKVFYEKKNK